MSKLTIMPSFSEKMSNASFINTRTGLQEVRGVKRKAERSDEPNKKARKDERNRLMNVILNNRHALECFPPKLKNELTNDQEFMTSLVQNCKDTFRASSPLSIVWHASDELKNNKDFIMSALKPTDGKALEYYASDELKNDKEFILAAMEQWWWEAIKYASYELKNDKEFMLFVMKGRPYTFRYASNALMHDRDTVMAAVTESWKVLKDMPMYNDDKEVIMTAVVQDGWALEYASDRLKNDKEVVMAAIAQNGCTLRYASDELKSDREVVMAAVTNNGLALEYSKLKDDDIVKAAKKEIEEYRQKRNASAAKKYIEEYRQNTTRVMTRATTKAVMQSYYDGSYDESDESDESESDESESDESDESY